VSQNQRATPAACKLRGLDASLTSEEISAMAKTKTPSPIPLTNDIYGTWKSMTIAAGLELDVFTLIADGKRTAAEVAAAAGADSSAMRRLLDTLVAFKYLRRKGDRYSLEPFSATFLARGSDLYFEGGAQFVKGGAMAFSQLADVVRSGRPLAPPGAETAVQFFTTLVRVIFPMSYVPAKAAVAAIGTARVRKISAILDVAAGSGAWSLPFAQASPKARVTVVDFPAVTAITREYAARYAVGDRYNYLEGNLRELDFGRDKYDLAIFGHIIHSEGAEWGQKLIRKTAAALKDKGQLLIAEFIPNDDRTGPVRAMLFGLNMLIHAAPGADVFTMRQYRTWLKEAGFRSVKTIQAPSPSPLILATK
jgi:ubiquinone/menaquinone biosynthesis C-methylase UbiE